MMDLPTAENIKSPKLALIAGLLIGLSLGAGAAWTASTTIHDAQFKVLNAFNTDLQRQVSELQESSQGKDVEMARLREQLSELSPQRREAEAKRRRELEVFIRGIDKEIAQRKTILWRPAGQSRECDLRGENCRWVRSEDRLMSDAEKRAERELDTLNVQRHEARKRLIEVIAK